MTTYQSILFTLFFLLAAIMVLDRNVAEFFVLKYKLLIVNIKKWWLMGQLHPRNPLTNYLMERRMKKLAKELEIKIKEKINEPSEVRD